MSSITEQVRKIKLTHRIKEQSIKKDSKEQIKIKTLLFEGNVIDANDLSATEVSRICDNCFCCSECPLNNSEKCLGLL